MHAYLIVTKNTDILDSEVKKITDSKGYKLIEFPVQKIDDARNLNSFVKFTLADKTAILIRNFQSSTEECANAILKNLEEPQENLCYILHTISENSILPTIKSRCSVIRPHKTSEQSDSSEIQRFIESDVSEKVQIFGNYKKREDAVAFIDRLLLHLTQDIKGSKVIINNPDFARRAILLKKALSSNGNVNLHFLNFLSHISN